MARPRETYWYALKVFYNKVAAVQTEFKKSRYETYYPTIIEEHYTPAGLEYVEKPLMASLLFVKCPERFLQTYKWMHDGHLLYYTEPGTNKPGRIPDKEMENFRKATSIKTPGTVFLGSDTEKYCVGDRVRVTEGIYKGLEGHVKRIRHARKVLVSIRGIAIIALANIHPQFLEKI